MSSTTKTLTGIQVKDETKGTVRAVFATLGVVDHDGDLTLKGAFTDGQSVVISAFNHESWKGALPVGTGTIREDGDDVILDGEFLMDTSHGRDAFLTVKKLADKGLGEWSYSLHDVDADYGAEVEGVGYVARVIKGVRVREVSPVLAGAGINTRTLEAKGEGMKFTEHAAAVLADADVLVKRATEVVTLRAQKGKSISDESLAELTGLKGKLTELVAELDRLTTEPEDMKTDDGGAIQEELRMIASTILESH